MIKKIELLSIIIVIVIVICGCGKKSSGDPSPQFPPSVRSVVASGATCFVMAISPIDAKPYVAFKNSKNELELKKFSNTLWQNIKLLPEMVTANNGGAWPCSIRFTTSGILYISFLDANRSWFTCVAKYSNNTWDLFSMPSNSKANSNSAMFVKNDMAGLAFDHYHTTPRGLGGVVQWSSSGVPELKKDFSEIPVDSISATVSNIFDGKNPIIYVAYSYITNKTNNPNGLKGCMVSLYDGVGDLTTYIAYNNSNVSCINIQKNLAGNLYLSFFDILNKKWIVLESTDQAKTWKSLDLFPKLVINISTIKLIVDNDGNPCIAYEEATSKNIKILKYDGSKNWNIVTNTNLDKLNGDLDSFKISKNGEKYLAVIDSKKQAIVINFNS